MSKVKALVLLSGGLDSMLAAKTLLNMGVEVVGISFISNFFNAEKAFEATKKLGIPLIAYNIADEHLEMTKQPKYGHGKNMNPCIDCHAMMIRHAKEVMEGKEVVLINPDSSIKAVSQAYDFVATGEVLGQRPMSQNGRSLAIVAKYSGIGEKLVRPLSGKLLPPTEPELAGKIKREDLLEFSGRSRQPQKELAAKYGITEYPSPGGGCILTDIEFSRKLREMFENWPTSASLDAKVLRLGRHFWFDLKGDKILLTIGRNEEENATLLKLAQKGDLLAAVSDVIGPVALIKSKSAQLSFKVTDIDVQIPRELNPDKLKRDVEALADLYDLMALLVGYYAPKARGREVIINFAIK